MKLATSIIEVKLRFSGIIDGAAAGNIIIRPAESQTDDPGGPEKKEGDERGLFVIKGNKGNRDA